MRFFLFLLFGFTVFAQSSNISVISAEKVNIVYRGVSNPLKIAVPGAKSFTATAPGLTKVDDNGNYMLAPGAGNEVKVIVAAVMENGITKLEEKVFRIKNIPAPVGMLDNTYANSLLKVSKKQLMQAEIGLGLEDFLFDVNFIVTGFTVEFFEKKKFKPIEVHGNKMNDAAIHAINKLKSGDIVIITNLRHQWSGDICMMKETPIAIEIAE